MKIPQHLRNEQPFVSLCLHENTVWSKQSSSNMGTSGVGPKCHPSNGGQKELHGAQIAGIQCKLFIFIITFILVAVVIISDTHLPISHLEQEVSQQPG
jgi:hypothetical protein